MKEKYKGTVFYASEKAQRDRYFKEGQHHTVAAYYSAREISKDFYEINFDSSGQNYIHLTLDTEYVEKASKFAGLKHAGQKRDDGDPFVFHPITVAGIIRMVSDDDNLIAAAYLHDTIEDTETTYEELVKEFNQDIADLVMEVTHEGDKKSGYYFPRLKTQRGIMLKLADRLSNVSDMKSWSDERKQHYLDKTKFWRSE